MIPITLTFLGTSNAMPSAKRNHPAILLEYAGENILFDCGEGTQRQLRIARINPNKITKLVLTHLHGDHTLGIPGLLATMGMSEYSRTLQVYGPKNTRAHFALLEKAYGKFNLKYEIHDTPKTQKDFSIEKASMSHGLETYAYAFIEKQKTRLHKAKLKKLNLPNSPLIKKLQLGQDIVWKGKKISAKALTYTLPTRKITYITDTSMNQNTIKLAKNSDILICEATYSAKEKAYAQEHKHLTTADAATIAKKSRSKELVLIHTSQRYENSEQELLNEAKKIFKNTRLAKDFDQILLRS